MESDYVFSILIIRQESHLNLKSYALIPIYLYQSFKIKLNLIEFLIFNFNNLTELNWINPIVEIQELQDFHMILK